ncbi:MAG: flagellin FliC [Magnetococcales bacterium]|nr:flagellin FliC [Magnetococcales bacterium]
MALSITSNLASLNAQRQLTQSTNTLGKTFERLSSGLRINRSADDSAGLSISTRMTAQVRGISQAIRNGNDAISLIQVAEAALNETTSALQRIRELSVQSANDTMTSTDRRDVQLEINQLLSEIDRIANTTTFNKVGLLSGAYATGKKFQVGADGGQTIQMSIRKATTLSMMSVVAGATINVSTQASANKAIGRIDSALDSVSDIRARLGAYQNRFEAVIANLSSMVENTSAARSRILDADIAAETANLTKNSILQQAGTAVLAQANQQPAIALKLLS